MINDWASISRPHLAFMFNQFLIANGQDADIYQTTVSQDVYQNIMPDKRISSDSSGSCKVLIKAPLEGFDDSSGFDFISLSDKVTDEQHLVTPTKLQIGWVLQVHQPDGSSIRYKITAPLTKYAWSKVAYGYKGIVV